MVFSPTKLMRVLTTLVDRSLGEDDRVVPRNDTPDERQAPPRTVQAQRTAGRTGTRRRTPGGHPHLELISKREGSHGKPRGTAT
jgi:hypothetical protein